MKRLIAAAATAGLLLSATTPVMAADNAAKINAKVIERNAKGRAISVEIDGTVYAVCDGTVTDNCINPRQAGLNWGNVPLDHWPGHPASSKTAGDEPAS